MHGRRRAGSRGQGTLARVPLGSVADEVVTYGTGIMVVVPDGGHRVEGPIVLGADGSAGCATAARYAFETAAAWRRRWSS